MIDALKILVIFASMLALYYPFIPMRGRLKKLSVASSLRYNTPHNRKNIYFAVLALAEFLIMALLFGLVDGMVEIIYSLPFLGVLFRDAISGISSQIDFIIFVVDVVFINIVTIYAFLVVKAILKKMVISPAYGLSPKKKSIFKRKRKNKKNEPQPAEGEEEKPEPELTDEEKLRKRKRVPDFIHSMVEDETKDTGKSVDAVDADDTGEPKPEKPEYGPLASAFLSLFFEGEGFRYARPWVVRSRVCLQWFVRLVLLIYGLLFATMLLSVFFPMPKVIYDILIDVLRIPNWYMYPMISVIFLREICNTFDTESQDEKTPEEQRNEDEKEEDKERDARIRALLAELKKRFDAEHSLRYYPEAASDEEAEYVCTNVMYASALEYIKNKMKESSGRVVQSYMEFLDALYRDSNAYFSASFYSELGEYLTAYGYTRLLAGSRLIFVVADPDEKETLQKFLSDRLMELTGSSEGKGWRVYTADERLDQADILIACPEDFVNKDIITQYPSFFEESCNAIFIDADRTVSLNSYICPIIATKLQNATGGRIRFVFLTLDLLKGFAAGSLPRSFCLDKVLSFSSAGENEAVSYVLWNKESKKRRIYNKRGQKLTSLEMIIAELACKFGMDGVRLITEAPLENADRKILSLHNVEINNLYKNNVDVNYMVYSDDRCNLAASLYACTRFRGRKRSVVHILSKPYLLREYFMSRSATEDFIKRSSFIQPRVTEHAERSKLSLLRIFCDAAFENGISVDEFTRRMREVIVATKERDDIVSSAYCRVMLREKDVDGFKVNELAAYLIAGLCDNDIYTSDEDDAVCASRSAAVRAKDFYILIEPFGNNGYAFTKEKHIVFNREKEVFDRLLEVNRRVELRLNDKMIGRLDTFPDRAKLEYIAGQSIIYNNSEYEIEHVSSDGRVVYLRQENIGIKNCLDTVLLKMYDFESVDPLEKSAILNNSKSMLEEIRITRSKAKFKGTTYGFYSLTTDRQTLDFQHGVEGNPRSEQPNIRKYRDGRLLRVSLRARRECTDGMRLLMSAVFNEFIRTIFPGAYRCVAICPILEKPLSLKAVEENDTPLERIKTLYPFINDPGEAFVETDPNVMQFLFINDCTNDIGVLDWFYDSSARYMQEFLANVYSYLYWLKKRPEKEHYIYFGGKELPECFDLEGCCEVLSDLNLILSDDGYKDIETAGEEAAEERTEYCSFCHKPMESGRYSFFDKHRYICADCFETVDDPEVLNEIYLNVREYLAKNYPAVIFGTAAVKFDPVKSLTAEQILSEFYYRVDFAERTVYVERDDPANNVFVSILRGMVSLWQVDNSLSNHYALAQLYYEELCYLRGIGQDVSADWVYNNIPDDVRECLDEIAEFVSSAEGSDADELDGDKSEKPTSFEFMRMKSESFEIELPEETEDEEEEEYSNDLYDPNSIPRFWKRYLKGQTIEDEDEGRPEEEEGDEGQDESDASEFDNIPVNAPPPETESDGTDDGAQTEEEPEKKRFSLFKRKKKDKAAPEETAEDTAEETPEETAEDTADETPEETAEDTADETPEETAEDTDKKKKKKKEKAKKKPKRVKRGATPGERILPHEEDEKTNPKIRVYNDLVRAAYDYSEEKISRAGVSDSELVRIFKYVSHDYPELFWVYQISYSSEYVNHIFRCKDANGRLDTKLIDKNRRELRNGAKYFTKGITKKTDPYEALLTIYRRVVLTFDYNMAGLKENTNSQYDEDKFRSLHSALVSHKVVCAGYAAAMQYLLQSVGIVCAYVLSEPIGLSCHAFNMLKIGKYCYYLDATWGDPSNTDSERNKNDISYGYFCVPYEEFIKTPSGQMQYHIPRKEIYQGLKEFNFTNHEYYRYHKAYLKSYDENELIRIFAEAALRYDEETMGDFSVSLRCNDAKVAKHIQNVLMNGRWHYIISEATSKAEAANKKAAKLLGRKFMYSSVDPDTGVIKFYFEAADNTKESKKSKKSK